MNKRIKAKWLKALRSGKFKQTRALLKDEQGGYCCLGVLYECRGVKIRKGADFPSETFLNECNLPRSEAEDLAIKNDNGSSFNEIADYIQEFL